MLTNVANSTIAKLCFVFVLNYPLNVTVLKNLIFSRKRFERFSNAKCQMGQACNYGCVQMSKVIFRSEILKYTI